MIRRVENIDPLVYGLARGGQSIKIDIGKSFDKSISIDKLNLNDIDFIGQSIKFDTHTPTKCLCYRFYRIHRSLLNR